MTGCYNIENLLDKTVDFIEDLYVGLKKKEATKLKRMALFNRMSVKDFNRALKDETHNDVREAKATILTLGQIKNLGIKVTRKK